MTQLHHSAMKPLGPRGVFCVLAETLPSNEAGLLRPARSTGDRGGKGFDMEVGCSY